MHRSVVRHMAMRKKKVTRSCTSNNKSCQVFLSHAHKDKRLAIHMDSLIRKRLGPHVSIFNTSKTPMPEIDSTPVSDGYEVTTDEPISASAMSLCPSVYVDEDIDWAAEAARFERFI